jgi:hypothetical protein
VALTMKLMQMQTLGQQTVMPMPQKTQTMMPMS